MQQQNPGLMLSIAGLAAQIILENGAETYRVEDTVVRLCRSYGFSEADVIALSTGVIISVSVPGDSLSIIRRVRKRGINLMRVGQVNDLSRRIAGGSVSMEEAYSALRAIDKSDEIHPLLLALLAGGAAGCFSLMFGGGLLPTLTAFVSGIAAHLVNHNIRRAEISLVLVSLVGGAVCALVTMAAFFLFHLTPPDVEAALSGAIMPLISGLMMTNAVRDTLRGDLLSGMARGMEALLVAIMVALGISMVLQFYLPGVQDVVLMEPAWYLCVLYAGVATMFFCPLLRVPGRAVLPASLLGAAAYGAYLLMRDVVHAGPILSLFLASAVVAVLCDLLARRMRMITTIFLCAALVPLVPGLGLYRTMLALLLSEYSKALGVGLQTLFIVGAIALGAAIGSLRIQRPERLRKSRRKL